jgi:hypothetical protein
MGRSTTITNKDSTIMDDVFGNWVTLRFWVDLIPAALVAALVMWAVKKGKIQLVSLFKLLKLKELKKIKSKRFNYAEVNYNVVKTHSLMILFYGFGIFFLYDLTNIENTHWLIILIKSAPLYIIEIVYLSQRSFTKTLIKYVGKIRITS